MNLCMRVALSSALPVQPSSSTANIMDMVWNLRGHGRVIWLFEFKVEAVISKEEFIGHSGGNQPFKQILAELMSMWEGE